jgi:hypothetical protein
MRQFTRSEDNKVQLYFNCPEKINQIARMCKYTDYKDITVIIHTFGESGLPAKHRIKFGKGWMGKGAGIRGVDYLYGGLKGIHILIIISESVDVIDCWLEGSEDRIHLGTPMDIINNWFSMCMSWEEWLEEREEQRIMDMENEAIIEEALIGEMEMLEEMQMDAEMREALQGQVD